MINFNSSMNSWVCLQGIPAGPGDNSDRIEYVLNFLDTTGCRKFNQWKPAGAMPDDHTTAKKSAEGFLEHLASNMDHDVLQLC